MLCVLIVSLQAAVVDISNDWEMHIAADSMNDDEPLVGYVCPREHPWTIAQSEGERLRTFKKLAVAIDIDDTLLRLIRFEDSHKYPAHRIRHLPMFVPSEEGANPEWVVALSSNAEVFLEEVSKCFKMSLYSVGIPKYVEEVAQLLDPQHKYFDWDIIEEGLASARHEHDGGETSPKRFDRLFTFANLKQEGVNYELCTAVDDSALAWHAECRDRVVDPRPMVIDGIWDSNLLGALSVLTDIYTSFYANPLNLSPLKPTNN